MKGVNKYGFNRYVLLDIFSIVSRSFCQNDPAVALNSWVGASRRDDRGG